MAASAADNPHDRVRSLLREALGDDWSETQEEALRMSADHTIDRYLRANAGDARLAALQLASTVRWRHGHRPDQVVCKLCAEDPASHSLRPVGLDARGRVVLYTCFATAYRRFSPEHNIAHLTRALEDASALMDGRRKAVADKWVIVADFHGYGLRDNDPRVTYHAAWLLQHYPERLGLALIVGAPRLFGGVYRMVRPLLDATTAAKVCFVASADDDAEALRSLGPEMLAWLRAEVAHNRTPGRKHWWEPAPNDSPHAGHHPRGLDSFVQGPFSDYFWPYTEAFDDARQCQCDAGACAGCGR